MIVEGKITNEVGKKLKNAKVLVINGNDTLSVTIASNGKYQSVEIPRGADCELIYSCEGYLNKSIQFHLREGHFESCPEFIPMDIPMTLTKKKNELDYSGFDGKWQIGRFVNDPVTGGVKPDLEYSSELKNHYTQQLEEIKNN